MDHTTITLAFICLVICGCTLQCNGVKSNKAIQSTNTPIKVRIADALIGSIFSIKPLYNIVSDKARQKIVSNGESIGINWKDNVQKLESDMDVLLKEYDRIRNPKLLFPDYYLKPFHAYDDGNLSWKAAMEVQSAALTVHAPIYTQNKGELDILGDYTLRNNYHINIRKMLTFEPKRILDIGCSTGLSTVKLHETFPDAEVIGLDLSPYFLAVAKHELSNKDTIASAKKAITYLHGVGEDTDLGKGDVDMISLSLVSHELPLEACKNILMEAYRILPTGGAFTLMDIDPTSIFFQRFASNPFAFSAFKSTEPWIAEYVSMDLEETLRSCGFSNIQKLNNSPRHRSVVAYKL